MEPNRLSLADLVGFDPESPILGEGERRFLCPFEDCLDKPEDANHRSLSANMTHGAWKCWRCKTTGKLVEFRNGAGGRTRGQLALPRRPLLCHHKPTPEEQEEVQARLRGSVPLKGTPGENYVVNQRGVPLDLAEESGLLYHPSWYGIPAVLMPIVDKQGELVAVSGRSITGKKIMVAGPKGLGFFVTPGATTSKRLVITEAAFDSLTLHMCGVPSIALMGTSWPSWLPAYLAFKEVLVALDDDKGGNEASALLIPLLRSLGAKVDRLLPPEKDWNTFLEIEEHGEWMVREYLAKRGLCSMPVT